MARLAVLHAAGTAPEHGPVAASSLDGHRAAFLFPFKSALCVESQLTPGSASEADRAPL
jgi:hypothetical protein